MTVHAPRTVGIGRPRVCCVVLLALALFAAGFVVGAQTMDRAWRHTEPCADEPVVDDAPAPVPAARPVSYVRRDT